MKKILLLFSVLFALCSCQKDDFFDRFGPEVLFYQYNYVETADFVSFKLGAGVTEYIVKARVSAPNKLHRIEVFRDGRLVDEITDFSQAQKPTEYFLAARVESISAETKILVVAIDKNGKRFSKGFTIGVE